MDAQAGSSSDFFNYWSNLAKTDPERLERERREAIETVIASAPEHIQQRLRGLQWRIDIERSRADNPLSACIRLNKMMADYVFSNKGLPCMSNLFQEVKVNLLCLKEDLSSLAK